MAIIIMISTYGCVNGLTLIGARLLCNGAMAILQSVSTLNSNSVPAVGL